MDSFDFSQVSVWFSGEVQSLYAVTICSREQMNINAKLREQLPSEFEVGVFVDGRTVCFRAKEGGHKLLKSGYVKDKALVQYMGELNRKTPSLHYGCSLDADIPTRSGSKNWNSYCYLSARDDRDSRLYVKFFLESLPEHEQDLMRDLLCGTPRKELAFAYGLDNFQLDELLERIGNQYLAEYGEN